MNGARPISGKRASVSRAPMGIAARSRQHTALHPPRVTHPLGDAIGRRCSTIIVSLSALSALFRLPVRVLRSLERLAMCGDSATGFAGLRCDGCGSHRVVAFRRGTRGLCLGCGGGASYGTLQMRCNSASCTLGGVLGRKHGRIRTPRITAIWRSRWTCAPFSTCGKAS